LKEEEEEKNSQDLDYSAYNAILAKQQLSVVHEGPACIE